MGTNAFLTFRGRRLLPLLTIVCTFAVSPATTRADVLISRLTAEAMPIRTEMLPGRAPAPVEFRARGENQATADHIAFAGDSSPFGTLPVLAMILVVPPGTQPVPAASSVPNPPPPPPPPAPAAPAGGDPGASGSGQIAGGGTPTPQTNPEPASLILALTGSGMAGIAVLLRRRRAKSTGTP